MRAAVRGGACAARSWNAVRLTGRLCASGSVAQPASAVLVRPLAALSSGAAPPGTVSHGAFASVPRRGLCSGPSDGAGGTGADGLPRGARFALIGACEDRNSSFLRGPALAPIVLRQAMWSDSANGWSELGVEVCTAARVHDAGDIEAGADGEADGFAERLEERVAGVLAAGMSPLVLGGDHSITYPVVNALAAYLSGAGGGSAVEAADGVDGVAWAKGRPLAIVHFDAHPDLYHDFGGNPRSHASPFARIMEAGLVAHGSLVQLGVRTMTDHQREQQARFGVRAVEMRGWPADAGPADASGMPAWGKHAVKAPGGATLRDALHAWLPRDAVVYVSFDLDAIDPGAAPAVSHHEPGGLSVRQAITALHAIPRPVIGGDVVELNPPRDLFGVTAMVGAKLAKEIASLALLSSEDALMAAGDGGKDGGDGSRVMALLPEPLAL